MILTVKKAMKKHKLRTKYGITLDDYDIMLRKQGGVCAICNNTETRITHGYIASLSVDHCHITHRVRGLLCNRCNHALGGFRDSTALLTKAIKYLGETV